MKVEKTVNGLPSIKKLVDNFATPDNGVEMTWGKLGELVFLKSQFWALKMPEETRAISHKTKNMVYKERATEQRTGPLSQLPPFLSRVAYQPPTPTLGAMTLMGQNIPTPQSGATTSSSTTLKHARQPASSLPAPGLDTSMANPEGN
jgi:hypothetical protein